MKRILFFREHLSGIFGRPLQRIPFDLGLSCPHRDEFGRGGCAFCAKDGGRARHLSQGMSLKEQAEAGVSYLRRRYAAEPPYAAYFQASTSTNAETDTLERLFNEALSLAEFKAVIVATRPDCLPDSAIDMLASMSERYELWVELGVQTTNDETLERINRGHSFDAVEDAVSRLASRSINTAAHVILGLPGETQDDYLETARRIARLPFSGIKAHNLLVMKGTPMERMLADGIVKPMNEYEYAMALAPFLKELPDGWVVMRLSADAPPEQVAAPKWWMKKGQFLDMFLKLFDSGSSSDSPPKLPAVKTNDGSYTLYHPQFRQHFHSVAGALTESLKKYLEPCRVKERLEAGENVSLLDVGFGLGFNACAAATLAESVSKGKIYIVSLEADQNAIQAAKSLPEHPSGQMLESLAADGRWNGQHSCIDMVWGDARQSITMMKAHFDFIFLDGFSPDSNPELWSFDFIRRLKSLLKHNGMLASYSSAFPFRGSLIRNGFQIFESKPFGRRRGGTVATLEANPWLPPITDKERLIALKSTAGTPYRDHTLSWTRDRIVSYRSDLVAKLRAKGVPKWFKEASFRRTPPTEPQEDSSPSDL